MPCLIGQHDCIMQLVKQREWMAGEAKGRQTEARVGRQEVLYRHI